MGGLQTCNGELPVQKKRLLLKKKTAIPVIGAFQAIIESWFCFILFEFV
jgi:hypothetical protein